MEYLLFSDFKKNSKSITFWLKAEMEKKFVKEMNIESIIHITKEKIEILPTSSFSVK
ncbi:hypothetical protein [Elizabethkingia anophelis]|uniref:hypothetical protein n=1 Tax=Elizabethkingia anophelis TaxID=1117645 RepID=UPI000A47E5CC|nr:hypothetical protein [Elizabethkingia anophelis]